MNSSPILSGQLPLLNTVHASPFKMVTGINFILALILYGSFVLAESVGVWEVGNENHDVVYKTAVPDKSQIKFGQKFT